MAGKKRLANCLAQAFQATLLMKAKNDLVFYVLT